MPFLFHPFWLPRPLLSAFSQLLVPVGESNYTVYLRAYNSANNTISAKSTEYVVVSAATFNPDNLCPDDVPSVVEKKEGEEEERGDSTGEAGDTTGTSAIAFNANASEVPGIVQVDKVLGSGGGGLSEN